VPAVAIKVTRLAADLQKCEKPVRIPGKAAEHTAAPPIIWVLMMQAWSQHLPDFVLQQGPLSKELTSIEGEDCWGLGGVCGLGACDRALLDDVEAAASVTLHVHVLASCQLHHLQGLCYDLLVFLPVKLTKYLA